MVLVVLLFGLLAMAASVAAQPVVPSPPGATRLAWNHSGENVRWFDIVVDGRDRVFLGYPCMASEGAFEVPLPLLTPGLRRLVVEACNAAGCAGSDPLLVSVVSAPIGVPATPDPTGPVCLPPSPGSPGRGGTWLVTPYKPADRRLPPDPL